MHIDDDIAFKRPGKRLKPQIASWRLRRIPRLVLAAFAIAPLFEFPSVVVPLVAIGCGVDPGLAIPLEVSHSGRRPTLLAIDPLGVLTTSHFQAIRSAGELHALHSP